MLRHRNTTETLSVPIGKKSSGLVSLDLHEHADGPHMLVAGTTGSGKTETILTFLVLLCTLYTPEQVNLLLMDMKGAGFVQRIGDDAQGTRLPHVVGTVTDIAGDETGTGMNYMLKRFLDSMNSEVKRRKLLLKQMGVDSVDGYTEARNDLTKYLSIHPNLSYDELKKLPPIPHLFLVIDEFTELMRITGENEDVNFRKSITSLARIGRSLGFHIILISQNIENAITPDIWVNSKARLCLKVATKEASKGMIGTDLAASPLMPGNGRSYLLVGTGSRFEYFQSGYSGADINRNVDSPVVITQVETSGLYSYFYDSEENLEQKVNDELFCTSYVKLNDEVKHAENENNYDISQETKDTVFDRTNVVENVENEGYDCFDSEMKKSESEVPNTDIIELNQDVANTGITQLSVLVEQIRTCYQELLNKGVFMEPHCIFQQPLPSFCYYNYNWKKRTGKIDEYH